MHRISAPEQAVEAQAKRRRLLLYGDSLTAGFHSGGRSFAPYGEALAEALFPEVAADITICGLSGLTATELVEGLEEKCIIDAVDRQGPGLQTLILEEGPFDLVVVMAGTNDLGSFMSEPAAVAVSIRALHAVCHDVGLRSVALSVPPNRIWALGSHSEAASAKVGESTEDEEEALSREQIYASRWAELNRLLGEWAQGPGASEGVARFIDVAGELVPFELPRGGSLWERDGLHLSPRGSAQLGKRLAPLLAPLLCEAASVKWPSQFQRGRPMPRAWQKMPECLRAPVAPPGGVAVPRKQLLVYGDSLTVGFYACGSLCAPYADSLVQALLPDVACDVWICGLSGLTAAQMVSDIDATSCKDCIEREGQGLRHILEGHGPFDLALLMAGTNDIGQDDVKPKEVTACLRTLHEVCHRMGTPTLALAVPPSKIAIISEEIAYKRNAVNCLLKEWVESGGRPGAAGASAGGLGFSSGALGFVDTEACLAFDEASGFWEPDGLHFSKAGSQRLGERLAPFVRPLLLDTAAALDVASGQGSPTSEVALAPARHGLGAFLGRACGCRARAAAPPPSPSSTADS